LDPDYLPALNEAAHLLASCPDASARNGAESVKLAERAVELSHGSDPVFLDTLAGAYAESGRFQQAIQTAKRALEIATRENKTALMDGVAARLRMYEAGVPYRDGPAEQ
jgi:Flp pilus assembly protein TadD